MAFCLRRRARLGGSSEASILVVTVTLLLLLLACACASSPRSVELGPADALRGEFGEVMRRTHGYVVEYEDDISHVVAVEQYEQRILDEDGDVKQRRTLASDFWVFQLPPEERWFAVRDVYEVDGVSVRERDARLPEPLSLQPGEHVVERLTKIAEENARFNIGDVFRTINVPTFALRFLRPSNRPWVSFTKLGEEDLDGVSAWVIGYQETMGPTIITTPEGENLLTRGRLWIAPNTGRVLRTELITGDARIGSIATITVTYQLDPTVELWVPVEMEERYESTRNRDGVIAGTATYSDYRRSMRN